MSWTALRQHWTFNRQGASGAYGPCYGDCNYHSIGADTGAPQADSNVSWGGSGTEAAPECLEVTTYPGVYTSNPDTTVIEGAGRFWNVANDQ